LVTEGRNPHLSVKPEGGDNKHLAITIAMRAIQNRLQARFVKASARFHQVEAAARAVTLPEATTAHIYPQMLVVDELG
jgi:DNA replication protein DnaC